MLRPDGPRRSHDQVTRIHWSEKSASIAKITRVSTAINTGTVRGEKDAQIDREIEFYARFAEEGITDARARQSAGRFRSAFDVLDQTLATSAYLKGPGLTVLDIAWVVYVNRLSLCGYPFARLHPNVAAWSEPLIRRPEFARELAMPAAAMEALTARQRIWADAGKSFELVCGL